jgi:hypothetical protein
MRIGIGCTTYLRPECLAKWKQQIAKHTNMDNVLIYIADDSLERKGVAFRKNECLRALKDCNYVFLFDDDCYPVKDGWAEFFINGNHNHLLFLNEKLHTKVSEQKNIEYYKNCGGVFMFLTKGIIKYTGAFDEKYELWGMEHCDYSVRILKEHGMYPMLKGTEQYLYSEDYSNPNHKSSIANEEKQLLFNKNFPKFAKGIEKIYIPL